MQYQYISKIFFSLSLAFFLFLTGCSNDSEQTASTEVSSSEKTTNQALTEAPVEPTDVVAKVGDQAITFGEVNTMLNSSAVVGLSIPALGTPERDTVRITLLDKFISSNLLYLDAIRHGVDKEPGYLRDMARFSNALLAGSYWDSVSANKLAISEEQIQAVFREVAAPDAELTDSWRTQIRSKLVKQQRKAQMTAARKALREGIEVRIYNENLDIKGDNERAASAPLAVVGSETMTWGQLRDRIIGAGKGAVMADPMAFESDARSAALEREIDLQIAAQKARAAGLDADPLYQRRESEYRKSHLVNLYRNRLLQQFEPDELTLKTYYEQNRNRFVLPETRKLQMVVVKNEDQAQDLKAKIEAGIMTIYQVARDFSIAANANTNLGEVGWVNQGEQVPALDEVIFSLDPGEIGGPVETPAGWHLVLVQDMKEAEFTDFGGEATRKLVRRRYLDEKLTNYTVELRKNEFPVEVYQDRLVQLAQMEANMVGKMAEEGAKPGSTTEQRVKELNKLIGE